jgi:hypothetical protein
VLFVDANVLIDHPDLTRWRVDYPRVTVVVLDRVARELHGLGLREGAAAAQARRASLSLEALRQRGRHAPTGSGRPRVLIWRGTDVSAQVDEHLAAEAAVWSHRYPHSAVAVVSRDHGVWERSSRSSVYCVLVRGTFDNSALGRAVRETLAAHPV